MTTSDLGGFPSWEAWSKRAVQKAPSKPGVYVFRVAGGAPGIGRLRGKSDFLYVGSTNKGQSNLQQRLQQHFLSEGRPEEVGWFLRKVADEISPIEVGWKAFDNHKLARDFERNVICRYVREHLELPPLNRQAPGKQFRTALGFLDGVFPEQLGDVLEKMPKLSSTPDPEN